MARSMRAPFPRAKRRGRGRIRPMSERSVRIAGFFAGLGVLAALLLLDTPLQHYGDYGARPALAAGIALLMAIWWLTSCVSMYATALIPLLVFPLTNVFSDDRARNAIGALKPYADPYIFLFMGGMLVAAAMQQWDLHRRIALWIMRLIGTRPARLLFGFLCATTFISMWISNTATAAMMMPIGLAVIAQLEVHASRRLALYGSAIMLSIAYGANVGGIATKIGTAPNGLFASFMAQRGTEVSFVEFMAVGLPFVMLFTPLAWWALWRVGRRDGLSDEAGAETVQSEIRKLGPVQHAERVVLGVFATTVALWMLSGPLAARVPGGWTTAQIEGATAMLAALVLVLWPVDKTRALALPSFRFVPWGSLVLLGGAFSMAASIQASGLSLWMGDQLVALREQPPFLQVVLASLATVGLSAFASNTATVAVMLNVLHDSVAAAYMPTVLFAATIAASCDFALPAGTPPNAIVFASGYVSVPRMVRTGVPLDVAAALLAAGWCWLVVRFVL